MGIKLTQKCIKLTKYRHKDEISDTKFGVNGHLTVPINTIHITSRKRMR